MAFPISTFTRIEEKNIWVGELSDVMQGSPKLPQEVEVIGEEGDLLLFVPTVRGTREGELVFILYQNAPTGLLLKLFND